MISVKFVMKEEVLDQYVFSFQFYIVTKVFTNYYILYWSSIYVIFYVLHNFNWSQM